MFCRPESKVPEAQWNDASSGNGLLCRRKTFRDFGPINHIPESRDVIGAAVLVIQIVGVFPDVETQNWRAADAGRGLAHERAVLISRGTNRQLAAIDDEPRPTAAESCGAGLRELFLEFFKTGEGAADCLGQVARRRSARTRTH